MFPMLGIHSVPAIARAIRNRNIKMVVEEKNLDIYFDFNDREEADKNVNEIIKICIYHKKNRKQLCLSKKTVSTIMKILEMFSKEEISKIIKENPTLTPENDSYLSIILNEITVENLSIRAVKALIDQRAKRYKFQYSLLSGIYWDSRASNTPSEFDPYWAFYPRGWADFFLGSLGRFRLT